MIRIFRTCTGIIRVKFRFLSNDIFGGGEIPGEEAA